jgi:hypothetical protein
MEAPSPIPSSQLSTLTDIPQPHPATRLLKPTSITFFIVFVMIIAIVIISVYFASVMGGIDNSTKLSSITPSPTIKVNTIKPTSVPTTSTPVHFISAALQASELDLGDTLVVSGTAEGATSVTITITTFPTGEVILRNSYVVLPDGSYEARIKLDTFSSGRYYMYAELPTGENTKLSFSIL